MDASAALMSTANGVSIAVRAQPRASKDALVGVIDDGRGGVALKIAVTAPPVEGEANEAIVRFLAGLFEVPRRDVALAAGASGRSKRFEIRGLDRAEAVAKIHARLGIR